MAEHAADHQGDMNPALGVVYATLCWLVYAIAVLLKDIAFALLWLLHLLYRPIAFTLQPFVYLGRFLLACLALPCKALVKFETLFIYLSIAAIVGVSGGLIISLIYKKITGTFLSAPPAIKAKVRSAKDYRQQKQKQKAKHELPTMMLPPPPQQVNGTSPYRHFSPGHISPGDASLSDGSRRRRAGLHTTTIMEEEDSEF